MSFKTPYPFAISNIGSALDKLPNLYSRVGQLGVYTRIPQPVRTVTIIMRDNKVVLLDPTDPKGPRQELNREEADAITFQIPTQKLGDVLTPSDIQGITAFQAGPAQLENQAAAYNRRLMKVRQPHDQTFEFYRMAGIKGVIVNPKGGTMYNLFTEFGIPKKRIAFDLDNAASDILGHVEELEDHIANNLRGDVTTGPRVLVSSQFSAKLRRHPKYEQYLTGHSAALQQIAAQRASATDPNSQRTVVIHNTIFESYTGQGTNSDGNVVKFIADGEGHAYPEGTIDTFKEYDAPPERMGEVNLAPSQEIHVYPHELPQGKGIDLDTESCKLCLCERPEVLVEVTDAAA